MRGGKVRDRDVLDKRLNMLNPGQARHIDVMKVLLGQEWAPPEEDALDPQRVDFLGPPRFWTSVLIRLKIVLLVVHVWLIPLAFRLCKDLFSSLTESKRCMLSQ